MHPTAARRIAELHLTAHPEGGHFREIFRSSEHVKPLDQRPTRVALTTIYFLLSAGEISRWHRVASDEVWHFYEGEPLELFISDPALAAIRRVVLGPLDRSAEPACVVPAHAWQAARPLGAYTLAGCTVGPGFDFADFTMLRDDPAAEASLRRQHAAYTQLL